MGRETARERLARAAFELFDEQGYERTTVDEIAERAGAGRTTFFRHYRSKDDVIFPDHDRMIEQVTTRLATSDSATALVAVAEAVRQVLLHYVGEGDLARRRYALTSKVPALRDREIASVARYQRVFREFIAQWIGGTRQGALRAELMAAAVVSAHNHVLRRWLRGECTDAVGELDDAMREVTTLFSGARAGGATVVAFTTDQDIDALLPALRRLIEDGAAGTAADRRPDEQLDEQPDGRPADGQPSVRRSTT